jgi:prepilin-type N-terminal cleavage/methylation domain-containing protein
MKKTMRAALRGFSVLELSVAVAIVGVAVVTVLIVISNRTQSEQQHQARSGLAAARTALTSFAFVHSRLPCPARTTNGKEDCDGAASGYLPFSTLGMVDRSAGEIRYELATPGLDRVGGGQAITVNAPNDRGVQTWPRYTGGNVALTKVVDAALYDGKLDFCAALEQGPLDRAIVTLTAPASSGLGAPRELLTSAAASRQLGCAGLLATAARAHFNTALAAAAMSNSFVDYKAQFDVAFDWFLWDWATGVWSVADSSASLTESATKGFMAVAASFQSGLINMDPVFSLVNLVASTASYGRATSNLARFTYALVVGLENRERFADINDRLFVANEEIQANVALDAAIGNVVGYQGMSPPLPPASPNFPAYDGSGPLGQTARDFTAAIGP